jgi:hypothetical protein
MSEFSFKQHAVDMPIMDDIINTTLKNRVNVVYEQMARNMNTSLYGDRMPSIAWSDRPWLWRVGWRLRARALRMRDAWLVLTGKADIDDDY